MQQTIRPQRTSWHANRPSRPARTRHPRVVSALIGVVALSTVTVPAANAKPEGRPLVVRPGESIQAAIDRASPGSTIVVLEGTYAEQLLITKDGLRINGERARLVPPATRAANICTGIAVNGPPDPAGPPSYAGVCIAGDIDLGAYDLALVHRPVAAVRDRVSHVTLNGLAVQGFDVQVVIAGGEDVTISGGRFSGGSTYDVLAAGSPGTTYRNNVVVNETDALHAIGMCIEGSPDSEMVGNDVSGHLIGLCLSSDGLVARNNSVHDNHFGIYLDPFDGIKVVNNRSFDNRRAGDGPFPSGVGIVVEGATGFEVAHNVLTGNYADNSAFGLGSGGIAVLDFATRQAAGVVHHNRFIGNAAPPLGVDIAFLGAGSGVTFTANRCATSLPGNYC